MHCRRPLSPSIRIRSGERNPTRAIPSLNGWASNHPLGRSVTRAILGTETALLSSLLMTQIPTPSNSTRPYPVCDGPSTQTEGLSGRMLPQSNRLRSEKAHLLHSCPMRPRLTFCTVIAMLRQERSLVVLNIRGV